ncbi:Ig-like domain-containing protein [Methanobrevibacter sp.]|uniref:Ig-like domain-containing protein n=1 Tax=Methanobrevibacter sp. TaxID=66852 RepID=UPI00389030DE
MKRIWIFIFILFLCIDASCAFSLDDLHNENPHTDRFKYSFNSSDLIKDYQNESQYTIQLLENGKPAGAGEKINFFINGVRYTRTTNADGVATLDINLIPGNYIIYCQYGSCKAYNNIMVL